MRILTVALCLHLLTSVGVFAQAVPCAAKDGDGIAACVNAAHPDKLGPTKTLAEREANARFLRDRLIETARCAGLDVGRNCKRGNCADISVDFVAWKTQGRTQGVDVIGSWDDLARTIRVGWFDGYGPPTYGSPTYQAYGPVSCVGQPIPDPGPIPPNPGTPPVDLGPILSRLAALESQAADLYNHTKDVRSLITNIEQRIPTIESRVFQLEQVPVPKAYRCSARVLGIPVSCSVTAEVNP